MRILLPLCAVAATTGCVGASAPAPARRAPGGAYRIEQSILVECDVPHFEEWAYDRNGRTLLPDVAPRYLTASAGCGAP